MTDKKSLERISINSKVMAGKPVIRGMRITVEFILNLMAHDALIQDIVVEYQGITVEDVQACKLFGNHF